VVIGLQLESVELEVVVVCLEKAQEAAFLLLLLIMSGFVLFHDNNNAVTSFALCDCLVCADYVLWMLCLPCEKMVLAMSQVVLMMSAGNVYVKPG